MRGLDPFLTLKKDSFAITLFEKPFLSKDRDGAIGSSMFSQNVCFVLWSLRVWTTIKCPRKTAGRSIAAIMSFFYLFLMRNYEKKPREDIY